MAIDKNEFYRNLAALFKTFKNRPHHLAKYLISQNAFSEEFIKKILKSKKLNIDTTDETRPIEKEKETYVYMVDIAAMDSYYTSITSNSYKTKKNSKSEDEKEYNKKLRMLVAEQKYEEAAVIRDYMIRNGLKISLKP